MSNLETVATNTAHEFGLDQRTALRAAQIVHAALTRSEANNDVELAKEYLRLIDGPGVNVDDVTEYIAKRFGYTGVKRGALQTLREG